MKKGLIISHYNENLDWINNISDNVNIYIYTKGDLINEFKKNIFFKKLDNIGNEHHTYFYHIINNYNKLDDILYFSQGNPFEHSKFWLEKFENDFVGGMSDFNLITNIYEKIDEKLYKKHINHKYQNVNYDEIVNNIFIDPWNDKNAIYNINYIIDKFRSAKIEKKNWIFNANGLYSNTKNNIINTDIEFYSKCYELFYDKNVNMVEFVFERLNKFIILK